MATVNIYEMAQTWNNGAVAFTAIGMNVTDTASDAASLLMDLQVGGASKFSVNKAGKVSTAGYFEASRGTSTGYYLFGSVFASQDTSNNRAIYLNGGQILGRTSAFYGGRLLIQSADHVVSIGDGANAQTFNIYNTYTDASNYERGFMKWNSNVLEIGTESAGTGTNRELYLRTANVFTLVVGGSFLLHAPAASRLSLHNGVHLQWSSTTSAKGSPDTGILRDNAGVVKVTDGSTGTGELIFIVPTSDPGITGALWNNGGTLAISA